MVAVAQNRKYGDATAIVNGRSIKDVAFDDVIFITFDTLSLTINPGSIPNYDDQYTDVPGVPGVCVKRVAREEVVVGVGGMKTRRVKRLGDILRFDSESCPEFWCEVRVVLADAEA